MNVCQFSSRPKILSSKWTEFTFKLWQSFQKYDLHYVYTLGSEYATVKLFNVKLCNAVPRWHCWRFLLHAYQLDGTSSNWTYFVLFVLRFLLQWHVSTSVICFSACFLLCFNDCLVNRLLQLQSANLDIFTNNNRARTKLVWILSTYWPFKRHSDVSIT